MMGKAMSSKLAFAFFALCNLHSASASPFSLFGSSTSTAITADSISPNNATLEKRCENPCGWNGWLCCNTGETCSTDSNNQAQCLQGNAAAATTQAGGTGYWQYYTSTWVQTDLVTMTSVYSVWQGATPAAVPATPTWNQATETPYETSAPLQCNWSGGESSCGSICCPLGQYCQVSGQCAAAATITTGTFSAPLRPTASTMVVKTATLPTTTTVPYLAPVPTGQNVGLTTSQGGSSGLSGGAIAGIVIGVLAALIILFFLIVCLCAKGIWDGLVALFGGGKNRRRKKETVEYYSHHSDRNSRRWYGDRPSRIERSRSPKRKGLGAGGVAGILGGLALALGIKRRMDKRRDEKSDISSSYYTDTYTGSSRSSSSDRRTRDTRRTRR